MAKSEPVLTLDTLVERKIVVIDDVRYEILNDGELSLLDYHRLGKRGERLNEIMGHGENISDADVLEASRALDEIVRAVLKAPDDVISRLSDGQKLQVSTVFSGLQRTKQATTEPDPALAPTGDTSSPS